MGWDDISEWNQAQGVVMYLNDKGYGVHIACYPEIVIVTLDDGRGIGEEAAPIRVEQPTLPNAIRIAALEVMKQELDETEN